MRRAFSLSEIIDLKLFFPVFLGVLLSFLPVILLATPGVTTDIKVNGADGLVEIHQGDSFSYSWSSEEATACLLTAPTGVSGISTSGNGGPIEPGHPWYPTAGVDVILTFDCSNSTSADNDSVTIRIADENNPTPTPDPSPVVTDIKVNGFDGPVTINEGDSFSYSWSSENATACLLTSPTGISGISTSGNGGPIDPTHPWYPTVSTPTILTFDCSNAVSADNDSVTIILNPRVDEPEEPTPGQVTTDIKANGSDGPVIIQKGSSYTYSWSSENATACLITSPTGVSGISTSGNGGPIEPGHPWYPTATSSVILTFDCSNATSADNDSVTIHLAPDTEEPDPEEPGPDNTCLVPDATGMLGDVTLGQSYGNEMPLQEVLNNNGYTLNANVDQRNYQQWNVPSGVGTIKFQVEHIDTISGYTHTFGYYKNGDINTFTPIAIQNPGDTVELDISGQGITTIGFAIDSHGNSTKFYTEQNKNPDGEIHAVVYNPNVNEYVLAFEDLRKEQPWDRDHQDIVVSVTFGCEDKPECSLATLTSAAEVAGKVGQAFSYTLTASSSSAVNFVFDPNTLPAGLTYSSSTKTISGTPTTEGLVRLAVSMENACGISQTIININIAKKDTPQPTPEVTVNLTANPGTITEGATSTLAWTSTNANICNASWTSATSTSGSQVVSPTTTTSYSITCNNGTSTSTASTTVTVNPGGGTNPTPVTVSLTANPGTITLGATSTLAWTSTNANSCSATWTAATSTSGSQVVSPATTTAYSITCANGTATSTASTTVTVTTPAPQPVTTTLTADPSTITQGQSSTLTWTSTNANICNAAWTSATSTSGTQSVAPATTTVYSITCGNGTSTSTATTTINVNPGGGGGNPNPITVSLIANPGTIDTGATSTLSWTSNNTNTCEAAWTSATSTSGSQVVSPSSTTSYSITCGNGTASSTATTTITVNTGGGGGDNDDDDNSGDGGGSGRSHRSGGGTSSPAMCFYLRDYLRRDFDNDPNEVIKLQAFLINFEGHTELRITGVFDQATFDAVSAFQMKYFNDILEPWGHTGPTGYVYILTKKKINEIYCQTIYPLNADQLNEIANFRAFLLSLRDRGVNINLPPSYVEPGTGGSITEPDYTAPTTSTSSTPLIPIVGGLFPTTTSTSTQGQSWTANLANVLFSIPESNLDRAKCLYEFLVIIIVLYVLGNVVRNVLYDDTRENARNRFISKWITIDAGIVIAMLVAYLIEEWCLILPLLIALIIAAIWTLTYKKHKDFRAYATKFYLAHDDKGRTVYTFSNTEPIKENSPTIPVINLPGATTQETYGWVKSTPPKDSNK